MPHTVLTYHRPGRQGLELRRTPHSSPFSFLTEFCDRASSSNPFRRPRRLAGLSIRARLQSCRTLPKKLWALVPAADRTNTLLPPRQVGPILLTNFGGTPPERSNPRRVAAEFISPPRKRWVCEQKDFRAPAARHLKRIAEPYRATHPPATNLRDWGNITP